MINNHHLSTLLGSTPL